MAILIYRRRLKKMKAFGCIWRSIYKKYKNQKKLIKKYKNQKNLLKKYKNQKKLIKKNIKIKKKNLYKKNKKRTQVRFFFYYDIKI